MTSTTRIASPQITSTINPTQGLIDYVGDVKPYHTKILDVLVEYVYTEQINATIREQWNWDTSQALSSDLLQVSSGAVQVPILVPTTIGERFGFDVHLFLQDSIASTMEDIRPVGYGMDAYSTDVGGGFGTNPDPDGLSITVVGSGNTIFVGSISGTTLTVTSVSMGTLTAGQTILGTTAPVASNTVVLTQLTAVVPGTYGVEGTYKVSVSQSIVSEQMSIAPSTFTVNPDGFDQDPFDV